jgi:hypothetical protein
VARWAFRLCGPIGRLVTMSRFASMVSTAAIKTVGGPLCCPPPIFHYCDCPAAAHSRSRSCSISASCLSMIFAILRR